MDRLQLAGEPEAMPAVVLPVFEGPLDLLLHLVRENKVSIWDIPIVTICDQYQAALRRMEALDLDLAGEYLVYAAWLLAIKSRMLLPRRGKDEADPRQELVERLVEYGRVKSAAAELAGLDEVRRGMAAVSVGPAGGLAVEDELDLSEVDVVVLAQALRDVLQRHRQDHPTAIEVAPMRYSVREKIVELFELVTGQKSFPFLSHMLTRPDRLEAVTFLIAGLELVRLGNVELHQRDPFAEIYLTSTGQALRLEGLGDA